MFDTILTIVVISLIVAFFGFLIGRYIYKKAHHLPTGECASCASKKNNWVKQYHKKYHK